MKYAMNINPLQPTLSLNHLIHHRRKYQYGGRTNLWGVSWANATQSK